MKPQMLRLPTCAQLHHQLHNGLSIWLKLNDLQQHNSLNPPLLVWSVRRNMIPCL